MRIASPPTRHSCFYGVDTPERAKLLAAQMDVAEMNRLHQGRQPRLRLDRRPLPRARRGSAATRPRRSIATPASPATIRPASPTRRIWSSARPARRSLDERVRLMAGTFSTGRARAGHRRQPRHRRGDRRGAGRARARMSSSPRAPAADLEAVEERIHAAGGIGDDRAARPHRERQHRPARRRRWRSAGRRSTSWCSTPRCSAR